MQELWVRIEKFPNYELSTTGRIKNIRTGKILKHSIQHNPPYPSVNLYRNGKAKQIRIHRLMTLTFFNESYPDKETNHIDGNKENNYLTNLEMITHRKNLQHAYDIGLNPKGDRRKNTRLKSIQIPEIRKLLAQKVPYRTVAKMFNVSCGAIDGIIRRKSWRDY